MLRILTYWFRWQSNKSARNVLAKRLGPVETEKVLTEYWMLYKHFKKGVKKQPTLGGTLMVNLAAMSGALYNTLIARGIRGREATRLFYAIAWNVYSKMGQVTWRLAGWLYSDPYNRLKKATELFRKFPFNSPSYQWLNLPGGENTVAFNCTRCPVAEYFSERDLADFCVQTWCAFDFPLARQWGANLQRSSTIAGGAGTCDFRWKVAPAFTEQKEMTS